MKRPQTVAEIEATTMEQFEVARKWGDIRWERDQLLAESDYVMATDYYNNVLDAAGQTAWTTYRQDLRDLPQTYSADPDTVVWPTKP